VSAGGDNVFWGVFVRKTKTSTFAIFPISYLGLSFDELRPLFFCSFVSRRESGSRLGPRTMGEDELYSPKISFWLEKLSITRAV
jgi:hypothetical protein